MDLGLGFCIVMCVYCICHAKHNNYGVTKANSSKFFSPRSLDHLLATKIIQNLSKIIQNLSELTLHDELQVRPTLTEQFPFVSLGCNKIFFESSIALGN